MNNIYFIFKMSNVKVKMFSTNKKILSLGMLIVKYETVALTVE